MTIKRTPDGVFIAPANGLHGSPSAALDDHDNPEWTAEDFARARGPDQMTAAELAAFPRTRGAGRKPAKSAVSIRLSPEVLAFFKAGGAGWQTRIDEVLKAAVAAAGGGAKREAGR